MSGVERKYKVVERFSASSWKVFVRQKLCLTEFEVEEAEKNNPDDIREQRYQMILTWQRKGGRDATIEKLEELAGEKYFSSSQLQETSAVRGNEQVYSNSGESKPFASNEESDSKSHKNLLLPEHDSSSTSGTQLDNKITGKIKPDKQKFNSKKHKTASAVHRPVENACDKVDKVKVIPSLSGDFEARSSAPLWKVFVRQIPCLAEFGVEEAEKNNPGDIGEQRYQMILTWQRKGGRDATIEKLEELAGENYFSSSQLQETSAVPGDTTNEQVYSNSGESKTFASNEESDNKSHKDLLLPEHDSSSTSGTQSDNKITGKIKPNKKKSNSKKNNTASAVHRPVESACDKVDKVKVIPSLSRDFEASCSNDLTYRILADENYFSSSQLQETSAVPGNEQVYSNSGETKTFASNEESDNKSHKNLLLPEHDSSSTNGTQLDNKITGKIKPSKQKFNSKKHKTVSAVHRPVENACDKVDKVKVIHSLSGDFEASCSNDLTYQISGPEKGLALILNNSFRDDENNYRKGSEFDVQHMKELWEQMGCDLYLGKVHEEKTAKEIKKMLKNFSASEGYSFLVIVIMSHGGVTMNNYYFYGKDKKVIKISEVKDLFQNSNSRSINIPKFFIFQLCRGDMADKDVIDGMRGTLLPTSSDMLFAHATMDGNAAIRTTAGSWFINAITNIFMKHAHEKHVADLLVMVQANMKRKTRKYKGESRKATSKHESSLTKNFFLFPGHPK